MVCVSVLRFCVYAFCRRAAFLPTPVTLRAVTTPRRFSFCVRTLARTLCLPLLNHLRPRNNTVHAALPPLPPFLRTDTQPPLPVSLPPPPLPFGMVVHRARTRTDPFTGPARSTCTHYHHYYLFGFVTDSTCWGSFTHSLPVMPVCLHTTARSVLWFHAFFCLHMVGNAAALFPNCLAAHTLPRRSGAFCTTTATPV